VDPVPQVVQRALADAADAPGYPLASGTPAVREAAAGWLARRHGVRVDPAAVLPLLGTKEFIASLPALLGCGPGDIVIHPHLAYPTYEVGARLAGARPVGAQTLPPAGSGPGTGVRDGAGLPDHPDAGSGRIALAWVNSPANPTGRILDAGQLRAAARWGREQGAVVASDECYIDLGWDAAPLSILHPDVSGAAHDGLLAVHSLSKRSNLAGYRAGFVTGDPGLVAELLEIRRHAGMIMPAPVQAAMIAALSDDGHADRQRARYAERRAKLMAAMSSAGWQISESAGGLYLWASRPGHDGWACVQMLAEAGILVAPGEFYGPAGAQHVRVALTATDERIDAAVARLARLS
jgi:aspartate/methionine/tyrosine aminotransferase